MVPEELRASLAADEVDRWVQQIRRGSTKLAVLHLLSERERYGYEVVSELAQRTKGALALAEGNVYPALHALESEGFVSSNWRAVEPGIPPRKYYRLSPAGRTLYQRLVEEWKSYSGAITRLLKGGE